jgi:L-alanine-DL-glutamate epimerase-like enolase superfamily enzyme
VKITDVRETAVPIKSQARNAWIDFSQMTVSVVAVMTDVVRDGQPVVGFGFNSNGRYAPTGILCERFIPRLLNAPPDSLLDETGANLDPHRVWATLMRNEKPGGHGERSVAVGVLDMAIWDVVAKIAGLPLFRLLANRFRGGVFDADVFVYAAGGYYKPDKNLEDLQDEIRKYLALGYSVVKMKIGGDVLSEDLRRIDAVLKVVDRPAQLAVDANGRFNLYNAIDYARALAPYGLRWFEEPGDPLDYEIQAKLSHYYSGPMATGENLFSLQDARNLIRYGGMRKDRDILQFDPALSYGLVEYLRILEMLKDYGWSPKSCIPHGGHQMALNIAAGLGLGGNESYPDMFQPFGGFADSVAVKEGRVSLPNIPGIGFEAKNELYAVMKEIVE